MHEVVEQQKPRAKSFEMEWSGMEWNGMKRREKNMI